VIDADTPEVEDTILPAKRDEEEAKAKSEKEKNTSEAVDKGAPVQAAKTVPAESETKTEEGAAPAEETAPAELPPFSAGAASAALREATTLATGCRKPGDPEGMATVLVTFAPSGRVTQAAVSGEPFAGTTTGGCIASRFREARVPAFSGDFVTVKKTVTIK
jgi:hypothetical protein